MDTNLLAALAILLLLLVIAGEWSKSHAGKWSEAIAKAGHVVVAWPVKPHELAGWIGARLRSRGVKATPDAVARLAQRVEGNLLAAAQEVDKLALLLQGQGEMLDAERMDALVADSARFDVFRLVDAALNGQPAQVARPQSRLLETVSRHASRRGGTQPPATEG